MSRYPVYIPSKGRWQPDRAFTAQTLADEGVPFKLVVEPQEVDAYADAHGAEHVMVLPFSDRGLFESRNWIKEQATAAGHDRHWQLDDNMRGFYRSYRGKRIRCPADYALSVVEDFTDRYENVAVSGMTYTMFGFAHLPPFHLNAHVYSCTLVNNSIPHRWRLLYNDDSDLCLQVLSDDWCTLLVNAVQVNKLTTMTVKGGNTDDLYQGEGRLKMAEELADQWPGVASVHRRYGRWTHHVDWGKYGQPLKLKDGLTLDPQPSDERVKLTAVDEVKSPRLKRLLEQSSKGPAASAAVPAFPSNREPKRKIN